MKYIGPDVIKTAQKLHSFIVKERVDFCLCNSIQLISTDTVTNASENNDNTVANNKNGE